MEVTTQSDSLSAGLVTTAMLNEPIPSLRVSWVTWNSGFRASGIRVGDRIVAVNGLAIAPPFEIPKLVGQYQESDAWKAAGAHEGDAVTLHVRRKNSPGHGWGALDIRGTLQPVRIYTDGNGRTLGPGGPPEDGYETYSESWSSWLDRATSDWQRRLDLGWMTGTFVSDVELRQHLADEDRVKLLASRYPGPFAAAMKADFETVRASLTGRTYPYSDDVMAYRRMGDERRQEVADAGTKARADFLAAHSAEFIPPFPSIDPVRGDRSKVAGKLVELPTVGNGEWIAQGAHTAFVFNQGDDWYVADAEGPAIQKILEARERYERSVQPAVGPDFQFIGRIQPDPALVVMGESGYFGLRIEAAAATVGGAFFIDLTAGGAGFTGEDKLALTALKPPPDDAPPETVMEVFFTALKQADQKAWVALFSPWDLSRGSTGAPILDPRFPSPESEWMEAREFITRRVDDVRVLWVDDPVTVVSARDFDGAPRIDEVTVEIDHLRIDNGVFRVFSAVDFSRFWTLRRMQGGPWRIVELRGI